MLTVMLPFVGANEAISISTSPNHVINEDSTKASTMTLY
jgi:hypothetical protein